MIPGAAALLIGKAVDDLSDTPCRWSVNYRTNDRGRDYRCGSDSRGGCNRMVTAAATVVAAAMVAVIDVDIAMREHGKANLRGYLSQISVWRVSVTFFESNASVAAEPRAATEVGLLCSHLLAKEFFGLRNLSIPLLQLFWT